MEDTNEKLENIEQILEVLIGQTKSNDDKLAVLIERNKSNNVVEAMCELENIPGIKELNNLKYSMEGLEQQISKLPDAFRILHHHNLDVKSRSYLLGLITLFIFMAGLFGTSVSLIFRNNMLAENSDKFKVVQGNYPGLATDIDVLYSKDKEKLIRNAEQKIIQHQAIMDASARELKTKTEYEKARNFKRKLSQVPKRKK